jgi:hypothetical protein
MINQYPSDAMEGHGNDADNWLDDGVDLAMPEVEG